MKRLERQATDLAEERNRLAAELGKTQQAQLGQEAEVRRWKDLWEQSRGEISRAEAATASLRSQNEGLRSTLDQIQRDLNLSKEALSARSTESDSAFIVFRQKTEVMGTSHSVTELRKQLKEADTAREEALSRETEVTLQVQSTKQEWAQSEARSKRALAVRDKEIAELQSEGNELVAALEDERSGWKSERDGLAATIAEHKTRVEKLSKQLEEATGSRDALQQARLGLERQLRERGSEG